MRVAAVSVCLAAGLLACATPEEPGASTRSAWRAHLREARRSNLDRLYNYAGVAKFPRNRDFPGEQVPYFIDARGLPCAVAHLVVESGHRHLADRVARENNHIRIADVTEGPVLDWILTSGLTQEECALIQPQYEHIEQERDAARVRKHLQAVHRKLSDETEASLAIALERLQRRLEAGPLACAAR